MGTATHSRAAPVAPVLFVPGGAAARPCAHTPARASGAHAQERWHEVRLHAPMPTPRHPLTCMRDSMTTVVGARGDIQATGCGCLRAKWISSVRGRKCARVVFLRLASHSATYTASPTRNTALTHYSESWLILTLLPRTGGGVLLARRALPKKHRCTHGQPAPRPTKSPSAAAAASAVAQSM